MKASALTVTLFVMSTYLSHALRAEKPLSLAGHVGSVAHVRFSPDSKWLVSVVASDAVRVWDVKTQEVIVSLGDRGRGDTYQSAEFSPDGSVLAACGITGVATKDGGRSVVAIWDTTTWKETANYEAPNHPQCIAFSPDGSTLFVGGGPEGRYFVWSWPAGKRVAESPLIQPSLDIAVTSDGSTLICGQLVSSQLGFGRGREWRWRGESNLVGWDVADNVLQTLVEEVPGVIICLAASADGRWLAAGGESEAFRCRRPGQLLLWDRYSQPVYLDGHRGTVFCVSFSPDDRILASAGRDRTIRLWYTHTGEPAQQLRGHRGAIHSLAYSPDGKLLASGSEDKTVRVWTISD